MESYTGFASVYDIFMDNVPYQEWADYVRKLLVSMNVEQGLVLDLGCGTGSFTEELSKMGYDMIGVDNADEMLQIAMDKLNQSNLDILYLQQDMREFELYGTVKAVVSICDSLNYILEEEELLEVFRLVNNYLDPKGIFIFDMNTIYKYRDLEGDNTFAENREDCSFIWENYYDETDRINEYQLTLFVKEEKGLYQKYEEIHYQKAYEIPKIIELIEKSGMEFVAVYDAFTKNSPHEKSDRVYFIAREGGK